MRQSPSPLASRPVPDIRQKTLAPSAVEFTPAHPLWSDGADKRGWLILLIARTGAGDDDVWMGVFVWDSEEGDAGFVATAATNVRDTQHDVPTLRYCETCHRGDSTCLLGLTAVHQYNLPVASAIASTPRVVARRAVAPGTRRVAPGDPDHSALLLRMRERGTKSQ